MSAGWLASAHQVPLMTMSRVKPRRTPHVTHSTVEVGNRVFHISTRHVPWNCSCTLSSLGALVCYAAEELNLACDEQHLTRLSQLAGILE